MAGHDDQARMGNDGVDHPTVDDLATAAVDDQDHRALDALARALDAQDPLPPGLVERATFAVALEELEVEVATLQREGLGRSHDLAGVRGDDHTLTMTFTAAALSLTIAVVESSREQHRIDGWVTSDRSDVTVLLRLGASDERVTEVRDGRFVFTDVPAGMVQVLVRAGEDTATVVTPVFEL